jgi:outer membrane lipoprotein carrier protein
VTRRNASAGAGATPLQILGGDAQALRDGYAVERGPGAGSFQLTPNADGADFDALVVTFRDGVLVDMEIRDRLQQRIVIEFRDVDRTAPLVPEDFHFEPPAGADLFIHDG